MTPMDDVKDIQKKDTLSKVLENGLKTRPFGTNIAADRAYTRAERCAAAIHLVTNHISPSEPTRIAARRTSLELLTHILSLRDEMRSGGRALAATLASIRKLISIMRLLSVAGFVSIQNVEVLIEALDELSNILERSQRSALSESIVLKSEDFLASGRVSDTRQASDRPLKDIITDGAAAVSKVSDTKRSGMRSESIMLILRARGNLGIKDIAANLPEYSEKMIQRELLILVENGKVKKSGAKRWSTYSLAT